MVPAGFFNTTMTSMYPMVMPIAIWQQAAARLLRPCLAGEGASQGAFRRVRPPAEDAILSTFPEGS